MRIITDSTVDISLECAEKLDVSIVPLKVNFGLKEYVDKYELSSEKFYEMLEQSKETPTTTLVNSEEFMQEFSKTDEDIVGIFISSDLSGTYQAAQLAKKTLGRENIYLVDSGTATAGLALLVNKAVQLKENGFSAKEIYSQLMELKERIVLFAAVDTLKYLVKGGRLTKTQGMIGNLLSVKPIISLVKGKISSIGKTRGINKSVDFIVNKIASEYPMDKNEKIAFAYSKDKKLLDVIKAPFVDYPNFTDPIHCELGSVIGTHAGPNAMVIAFFVEK